MTEPDEQELVAERNVARANEAIAATTKEEARQMAVWVGQLLGARHTFGEVLKRFGLNEDDLEAP